MNDWTAGYVADIGYTFGYYTELNPLRVRLAFLNAGLVPPKIGTACELGFGQGLSANIHAAATLTEWHGTDFNPSQAAFARELAAVSGADAKLYDEAFGDFARRDDLPEFDYIGLHGIWSWISDENRATIVDFIRRRLKVGGVLYISYNTLPGWAAFAPMRHLMTRHADVIGTEGLGIVSRINGAIDFAEKLLATQPLYARANPVAADRVKKLRDQNRHYLAHEYFNRDWHPMHFASMADWLAPAKLSYACSAHYLDHVDMINLSPEQQSFLKDIPDRMFRESVRDFMVNQQFRRDYWVKGPRMMTPYEQLEALRAEQVCLTTRRIDVPMSTKGALGEATMTEKIYNPILDALGDLKSKSLADVEHATTGQNINFAQLAQALMVLVGNGHVAPVAPAEDVAAARIRTDRLNAFLMAKAQGSSDLSYLASPATGGGVLMGRFPLLFLLARSKGLNSPAEWAQFAWNILQAQGTKLSREGQTLESPEDNLAELTRQALLIAEKHVPVLTSLSVL